MYARRPYRLPAAVVALVFFVATPALPAPSFDCRQAGNDIERLICSDAKLAALDQQMAELFSAAMRQATESGQADLLAEQRGWIKNRNGCAKRPGPRRHCVLEHYTQRTSRLEELLAAGSETKSANDAEPALFHCDDGSDIQATFLSGTPRAVRIKLGSAVWTLPQAVSGSGARYAGNGLVFWQKGGEALLERHNRSVNCRLAR